MIGTLIGIIITLIIVGVIYWAITQLLPLIPLPEPFARIIHVLLVVLLVIIVLWVILALLGVAGFHVPRFSSLSLPMSLFGAGDPPSA
jgi:hypothetical protein